MKLSNMSMKILEKRYFLRDKNNNIIETPEEMMERVVNYVCKDDEKLRNEVLDLMLNLKFLPNTPTLMNAGEGLNGMLSACFVIPVYDSLESIVHEAGWQQAAIHKMGGGIGLNLSNLRPKGDLINSTGGVTGGVLSFLRLFDRLSDVIHQGGKRNGANMGILNIDHPEIEDFIKCKIINKLDYNNFNLSVMVTDEFMNAVKNNLEWNLKFNDKVYKTVNASYLFSLISDSAWSCGCPGMIFEDVINKDNLFDKLSEGERMHMNVTNPCLRPETLVVTDKGNIMIVNLVGKEVNVLSLDDNNEVCYRKMINIRKTRKSEIYKIVFTRSDCYGEPSIMCSSDHKFYDSDGNVLYAKDLKFGDVLYGYPNYVTVTGSYNTFNMWDVYNGYVEETNKFFIVVEKDRYVLSGNCGEQPLYCGKYKDEIIAESCNLGSINLSKHVDKKGEILWSNLKNTVEIATKFLDKVIDVNNYPFDYIDKGTKLTRKIGLGVTGFSDMLIKMSISYDSDEAIEVAKEVMKYIQDYSHITSRNMGIIYGTYPLSEIVGDNKRNASITTIAPTGTIGRLMIGHGYALGIEPPFALNMKSNIIETVIEEGVHPLLIEKLKELGIELDIVMNELNKDGSSIQHIKEIPKDVRKLFLTAHEISIEQHLKIQAAFQLYTDNAVSKTINLKSDATVDDVSKAFLMAYDLGCKGVTVFRDMSKDGKQVFISSKNVSDSISSKSVKVEEIELIQDLIPRPEILPAMNFTKKSGCNTMFITLTNMPDKDGVLECFINTSGKGGCRAMQDGLAIVISVYQRYLEGIVGHKHAIDALKVVSDHLMNVSCPSSMMLINKQKYEEKNGKKIDHKIDSRSCPNAVAQVIKHLLDSDIKNDDNVNNIVSNYKIDVKVCSECGVKLVRQEGCSSLLCPACGIGGCN